MKDITNIFTEYAKDVAEYLESKLPDVPTHTVMEIAEYIGSKTCILTADLLRERDREWSKINRYRYASRRNDSSESESEAK